MDMARGRDPGALASALASCRAAFVGVGLLSGVVNLLTLTGSLFMLEVYDRVIPSRSVPTLVGLMVLALALYAFQGDLEAIRSRILAPRRGRPRRGAVGPGCSTWWCARR